MTRSVRHALVATAAAALGFAPVATPPLAAQAELAAWGNLEGIRVEGHLFPFETGVCLLRADGSELTRTGKERQLPRYSRESAAVRRVASSLGGISLREVVHDVMSGVVRVDLTVVADTAPIPARTTFCVDLPAAEYSDPGGYDGRTLRSVRFTGADRSVTVAFGEPTRVGVSRNGDRIRLTAELLPAHPARGDSARRVITIGADGSRDTEFVRVVLDPTRPGPAWDGLGGNFRLQNPNTDPQVVAYNLENLRVPWARVEMPWRSWHPDSVADPLAEARAGRIAPRARQAMEMARELHRRGMPVIVSAWFPPQWAVLGEIRPRRAPGDPLGNALDPARTERIYASLAGYLIWLEEAYGVEAALFSFNESDLGIDVRQTGEEHAAFIRGFGAYLAERGLATKMLLGDTSDGTAMEFIFPAMADSAALRYVGAVSFHSWRGWSNEILTFWGEAARQLNVPLLVGEGSTDAGAWRYPAIFSEPSFALQEIELYTRIMAISQPLSILQWQLTADYSLLAGGGVFGDSTALRPTQRFWNMKQLAAPPRGVHLPVRCDHAVVSCAAVGYDGGFTIHLVNNGAARPALLSGLPDRVTELRVRVTDASRVMVEAIVPVSEGVARVPLEATSFTTIEGRSPS